MAQTSAESSDLVANNEMILHAEWHRAVRRHVSGTSIGIRHRAKRDTLPDEIPRDESFIDIDDPSPLR